MNRDALVTAVAAFDRRDQPLSGRKAAAVALVVLDGGEEPGLVLTRRSRRLRAHAGQWALPGGRVDAGESAEQAALRELHEEIGLRLDEASVVGLLDDYATRSGFRITPVVMWAGAAGPLVPNADEVASVHLVSMSTLDAAEPHFVTIPESPSPVIQLPLLGTRIHAPTAAVVFQFREVVLRGRPTRVDHLEQPVFAWR